MSPRLRSRLRGAALGAVALALGCGGGATPSPISLYDDPAVISVNPPVLVPGSKIVVAGKGFVPEDIGQSFLVLKGTFAGRAAELTLPVRFVDYARLEAMFPGGLTAGLPANEGTFEGEAHLEIDNAVDSLTHVSAPLPVSLEVHPDLTPRLDDVATGVIYVNDDIAVTGAGFLLGDDEGETVAVVEGCYRQAGAATCEAVGPVEVPARPETAYSRSHAVFPFDPHIAGIRPGALENATVRLRNRHGQVGGATLRESGSMPAAYDIQPATIWSVAPGVASLGQYVEMQGGGFVGLAGGVSDPTRAVTTFELNGTFIPEGAPAGTSVSLTLVGEFVSGRLVRYVVNEEDELGQAADLRKTAGTFQGSIRPIVLFGAESVTGSERPITLGIGHVRQVVWLRFLPSYVESLRHFGLRALDQRIRARVIEVAQRDYAGVNIEFRSEPPMDFAQYEEVDITGPDPNFLGLLGYDNTPGKDVDNARLYDKIGGDNALTREDGMPGYGGIFVESFFGFSPHPGSFAEKLDGASPDFDALFDPFRPDRGGRPVSAEDLAGDAVPTLSSGVGCPAPGLSRSQRIGCALWALGSMIGTTMTHEVGHSLGLSDPYGTQFHNPGDMPNRLMDAGGARSFHERAEIKDEGPAVFCDSEYAYLRQILPTPDPEPAITRPPCY
ncbi:MAG TPA: hypothetical protein VGQ83_08135 [Polyangia bacterium]|jgi:hypothetical protein